MLFHLNLRLIEGWIQSLLLRRRLLLLHLLAVVQEPDLDVGVGEPVDVLCLELARLVDDDGDASDRRLVAQADLQLSKLALHARGPSSGCPLLFVILFKDALINVMARRQLK